ncbi:hypothetical protein [Modestobacter roseus]|uniref:Uncharacterized protein n=1 Tax=Modestobacter roseus TaxID=1181884 RepID=A0A562IQS8_9ACTN|nr:hypothetical protein [Modestobacter roseus]TWH73278.1 hypothetical protein JD78_01801 [Modestobacter roseus]
MPGAATRRTRARPRSGRSPPALAEGLASGLVVLVDRYVAMTRATQRLVVLTGA